MAGQETIRVWQLHYKELLTFEDAREIAENASNLIELLVNLIRNTALRPNKLAA